VRKLAQANFTAAQTSKISLDCNQTLSNLILLFIKAKQANAELK